MGDDKRTTRRKVLTEDQRKRRVAEQLERLEMDNYHAYSTDSDDEPRGYPKFGLLDEEKKERRKRARAAKKFASARYTRSFSSMLEEELEKYPPVPGKLNYVTAQLPPSKYPARHFCAVCGFESSYTCVQCGARYCCIKCMNIHKDTRCLKYMV